MEAASSRPENSSSRMNARAQRAWIWLGILALAFVVLLGLITAVGAATPVKSAEAASLEISAPPERVFAVLSDFAAYASWNSLYERSELIPGEPLRFKAKLHGEDRTLIFQVDESDPMKRLVMHIANNGELPYGARMIFSLRSTTNGCQVRMTLHAEVYNPVLRFFTHRIYGPRQALVTTLQGLKQRVETTR